MRIAIGLCVVTWCLLASAPCAAGGYFRRVPEVGEWARYEWASVQTNNIGTVMEDTLETKGTRLLKCVGEETIDNERYLWIEHRIEDVAPSGAESWVVTKVLVPEDGIVECTLSAENLRGWEWRDDGQGVNPFDFSTTASKDSAQVPDFLQSFSPATTGRMDELTLVVNGVEVQLSYVEDATLPTRETDNSSLDGTFESWPEDDFAFGVASTRYTVFLTFNGKATPDTRFDIREDLVATGIDAVSELPDHN